MAERVFLHVGTPKSGTTYLQSVLWRNAEELERAGLLLPARFQVHYAAAKAVTSATGAARRIKVDRAAAWPRIASLIARTTADALVSHELFASATAEQAHAAKALLEAAEVHLILTVRALHKQLPASWQEQVKGGLATPYDIFVQHVRDREAKGVWFWKVQDVMDIVSRWAADLPPERVHLVTVPADAHDPTLLWHRFAGVLGLAPAAYDARVPRRNESLGPVETELLRRVHALHDHRFVDRDRQQWTRKLLAGEVLGRHRGGALKLPERHAGWVAAASTDLVRRIEASHHDVAGSVADLSFQPPPPDARLATSVTDAEIEAACGWVISALQEELVRREPEAPPPHVGPGDGIAGILELLEHIRAADTDAPPRTAHPPAGPVAVGTARVRRTLGSWRPR